LGFTAADVRETVSANRRLLVEAVTGSAETPLVTVSQIHSNLVLRMGAEDRLREQPCKGDGILTDEPGILLGVQTADCIPVLLADRKRRAVAAIHAGWRGTVERIVEDGVERMRREFGCLPEDLIAAIGPGIGACCYAVGEEVLSGFTAQFAYAEELFSEVEGPALHLDLVEANRRQLLAAGLGPESISVVGGCTSCQPEMFFSHRASKGHAGRMMAVIGVRGAAE